jgi:hypothetical protein
MYSTSNLLSETNHLVSALRPILSGPITGCGAKVSKDNMTIVYVTYIHEKYGSVSPRVKINEKGEIFDPYFHSKQLSIVFDWLNRVGYNMERQINRTKIYKRELISKTELVGVKGQYEDGCKMEWAHQIESS